MRRPRGPEEHLRHSRSRRHGDTLESGHRTVRVCGCTRRDGGSTPLADRLSQAVFARILNETRDALDRSRPLKGRLRLRSSVISSQLRSDWIPPGPNRETASGHGTRPSTEGDLGVSAPNLPQAQRDALSAKRTRNPVRAPHPTSPAVSVVAGGKGGEGVRGGWRQPPPRTIPVLGWSGLAYPRQYTST